jgi:hypothetical protein
MRLLPLAALVLTVGCSPSVGNDSDAANGVTANSATAALSPDARAAQRRGQDYADALMKRDYVKARTFWADNGERAGGDAAAVGRMYARYTQLKLAAGAPSEISRATGVERIVVPLSGTAVPNKGGKPQPLKGALYMTRQPATAGTPAMWTVWGSDLRPDR